MNFNCSLNPKRIQGALSVRPHGSVMQPMLRKIQTVPNRENLLRAAKSLFRQYVRQKRIYVFAPGYYGTPGMQGSFYPPSW